MNGKLKYEKCPHLYCLISSNDVVKKKLLLCFCTKCVAFLFATNRQNYKYGQIYSKFPEALYFFVLIVSISWVVDNLTFVPNKLWVHVSLMGNWKHWSCKKWCLMGNWKGWKLQEEMGLWFIACNRVHLQSNIFGFSALSSAHLCCWGWYTMHFGEIGGAEAMIHSSPSGRNYDKTTQEIVHTFTLGLRGNVQFRAVTIFLIPRVAIECYTI